MELVNRKQHEKRGEEEKGEKLRLNDSLSLGHGPEGTILYVFDGLAGSSGVNKLTSRVYASVSHFESNQFHV